MIPLLAATPPSPPALVCTIKDVTRHWTPKPIESVRVIEGMTFSVIMGSSPKVEPRYVIDSRLTLLANEVSPPVFIQQPNGEILYRWTFEAPLGLITTDPDDPDATADALAKVEGQLSLTTDRRFSLLNLSRIDAVGSGRTLTQLQESATGTCLEQR